MITASNGNGSFAKQADYRKLSEHIVDIHRAMHAGEPDTVLQDALQDEMTSRWYELNERERKRLWGLSADLYMLQGKETFTPDSDFDRASLAAKVAEAAKQQDWESCLDLLRHGPDFLPLAEIACLRGRGWQQLGHDEAALLFYDHAASLKPDHILAQVLSLHTLLRLNRIDEAVARADEYAAAPNTHSCMLFKSADVLFASTFEMPAKRAHEVYRRIVALICRGLVKTDEAAVSGAESLKLSAYVELGLCYDNLGESVRAKQAYDDALAIDADHEAALIARGVHQYHSSPQQAVADFERVARNKSRQVWPYFYLTHHALVTGDYPKAIASFVRAIEKPRSPLVTAHLLEWSAIAQCELLSAANLASAAEDIRYLFETALSLSDENARIRKNFAAFQMALRQDAGEPKWDVEEPECEEFLRGEFLQQELMAA